MLWDVKELEEIETAEKWSNGNEDAYHFWYGVISGFPLCCIIHFCDSWHGGIENKFDLDEMKVYEETNIQHNKRIMCPLCVINEIRNLNIWGVV